ncbi:hypothetical protein HYT84_04045 [Candidatus Micrarchaeota archaeon]|nr:hypothetical protein [Candidatus Micrarchaeota archaeon]
MINKNSKGFFFVLITFLILGYIITSVSLITKSIDVSEKKFAEKFKFSNLEIVAEQISEEKLQKFSQLAAYRALSELNSQTVDYPLKKGPETDEAKYFSLAMEELIKEGTTSGTNFDDSEVIPPLEIYYTDENDLNFDSWKTSLEDTINPLGLTVSSYSFSDFKIKQLDYRTFDYSFTVSFSVVDKATSVKIDKVIKLNGKLDVQGLNDPAFARFTKDNNLASGEGIQKQFFFNPNYIDPKINKPVGTSPEPLYLYSNDESKEGQGWFYGRVVPVDQVYKLNPLDYESSILMGTFNEITNSFEYDKFGAYLVTSPPETSQGCGPEKPKQSETFNALDPESDCEDPISISLKNPTDKPFVVVPDLKFSELGIPQLYFPEEKLEVRLLFVTNADPKEVNSDPTKKLNANPKFYNIEPMRDFVTCGYYAKNENSPSYLQRLFKDSYSLKGKEFGIESFAFGRWIGGDEIPGLSDDLSRLDKEMANNQNGKPILGMPGCKNKELCKTDSFIGHFKLFTDSITDYLGESAEELTCDSTKCG